MTDTLIKLRRSAVPGKIPTDSQLQLGEVAINTYDGKMFYKQASTSNTILQVATTSLDLSQFATTTSAQLASVISNETGTGSLVFGTSPTLVTPVINGNTTFDSGTLFIDSVNNRVGVNTISPTQALHVVGNARITGGIADSNGNFGTPGQVLASNTSGIYWVTSAASGTDLSTTYANDAVTVNSSTGTNALIIAANGINAGVMSAPDKVKLNGIEAGAQVNVPTNLSIGSSTGTVVRIDSSTGTNATLPVASATLAGVVTNAAQTFAGVKTFNSTISGSISGNAGTATTLQTARRLWGQSFDGSNNVTGSLTFVGNITGAGAMTIAPGANTSVTFSTSGTAGFTSIVNTTFLGGTLNDSLRIRRILGRAGNAFYSDIYLRRDATGTDWTTARWHDAVGVDSSFLTPGVDTRVWYERDPNNEIHEWGTRNATSMLLDSSATVNASKLTVNGTISFGTQANKATITYTTNTARTYTIPNVAASDFVMAAGDQSIGGIKTFTSNPVISGTTPVLEFYESDQAADNQRWFARSQGSNFTIQAVTDAGSGGGNLWRFTRSGNQVTALEGTVSGSPAISLTNASRSLTFTGGVGTIGTTDAQSLQLNTNGSTKVTINSSGNVGVGTTASDSVPGFNRFIAIGDSDTGIGQISDGILAFATNFSEKMRITGGGNVGIGTQSPAAQLHLYGTGQTSAALTDAGDRGGMIRVSGVGSAAGTGGAILFASQQSETVGSLGYAAIRGLLANGSANTIGHLGFYTRNATTDNQLTERMRLTNGGSIGIGLTNPSTILHASGEITATDFNTTSDINVKKNIEPIDNAIFKISQINGVTFSFIDDPDEQRHAGVIAQDVEKVLPEAVKELGSGVKHVAYGNLIGLLVEAIKDQQKQIDELKALINK